MSMVTEATDYLCINSLVDLCCQTIADLITACKTPSEIRTKFNIISSDFTPAEQDYVCKKNQWAFESKDVAFTVSTYARFLFRRSRIRGGKDPDSFPDHLIEDVFTRMPAKSIARCCCVSKAWASIISCPSFTTLFSSRVSPQLLFACSQKVTNSDYSVDGKLFFLSSPLPQTLEGFSSTLPVNHQTDLSLLRGEEETNVSVNGLVLGVQEKPFTDNKYTMCECVIHNPSTSKSITLPTLFPARRRQFENTRRALGTQCYFGYDPVGKKYKVLSMTTMAPDGDGNALSRRHQCLTLRGGDDLLWRSIHCGIEHFPIDHDPICISGHIFYLAAQMINAEISMVVDFDVNSEKFTSIKYFDKTLSMTRWESTYKDMATLFNFNGKLASHVTLEHMKSFELWLLDDPTNHRWSRQFHQFPDVSLNCDPYIMCFAGVTHGNEAVWVPFTVPDVPPLSVLFYNLERKTVKSIQFRSSSLFEGNRFLTSLNHIECMRNPWEDSKGVAVLKSSEGVNGTIVFTQEGEECVTSVTVTVSGLKPGVHCIRVHNVDLKEFHVEDDGTANFTITDACQIALTGPNSISGRSVVILAYPDDLEKGSHEPSKATGEADGLVVANGGIVLQG
ncbi:hypothetical protein ARALYDRAFT_344438 [Arabidopsis lyrata subsp. lyrata]|uniref:F-box domain-containing protein n=1 Tax=Arabidopsis lyrata subsp. lyrata TaxID=81972 RepID=D7LFJ8_ARALL|nr:hypothetical protein ARALYDRAFT_344438 [Arabidopsis lyrata subsp. lyrata]